MSAVLKDGKTQREHLQAACEGLVPDPDAEARLAAEPPYPRALGDVWVCFQELHSRRAWGEAGPVRFTWVELEAYSRGFAPRRLNAFMVSMIFALEDAFFAVTAETKK
jgi:hypothetical protein